MKNTAYRPMLGVTMLLLTFSACKKYEDGPSLSLRTKKARLAGEWTMTKLSYTYSSTHSEGDNYTETYTGDGNSFTAVETNNSGTTTSAGTWKKTMTIEKDGTYTMEDTYADTHTEEIGFETYNVVYSSTSKETGTWNFTGGIGDYKNKERIVISPATRTSSSTSVTTPTSGGVSTTSTSSDNTTLSGEDQYIYQIKLLKNKEMRWVLESSNTNSYSSTFNVGSSSSNEKLDLTFKQ